MRLLLTWSDRGADRALPHVRPRDSSDQGPVLRLLAEPTFACKYTQAVVLVPTDGAIGAQTLAQDMEDHVPRIDIMSVPLRDPSDYAEVWQALQTILPRLPRMPIDVLLSAGTPQMQTLWVVLVQAGLLRARMLQAIPPAFVPTVHPHAVRTVSLDIEGFPEIRALRTELERLRAEVDLERDDMVGGSAVMQRLRRTIARVARSNVPVLVLGETGVGKELVARAIHRASARSDRPFIAENCGTFAESVIRSELFGHERGAFTGATHPHRGLFEQAHQGTLFLDEVGELTPAVQANLLRVLQEGRLRRLGAENTIDVDVRVIAATHRDLAAMVQRGEFREDLYYRLKGATLLVPPLRERPEDIPLLIQRFLGSSRTQLELTEEARRAVLSYAWPGNVRELQAEVTRWSIFCDGRVGLRDLAPELRGLKPTTSAPTDDTALRPLREIVREVEREAIAHALSTHRDNISQTAAALGIDRNTLKRKMKDA